ncbi:MAG: riboflavin biosynthesis protein RibF [Clostridia bacterium]|nr:riboflavin biosynthesis protein RibF [Clostridia bacterium]
MLEIIKYGEDEYDFPCLLVLGCFDGLHIGHADLLKKAKLQAKINGLDLGVMMFADGKGGKQLYTFEERVAELEKYGAKFVLKVDFNEEFKKIQPLDFLACLEDKLNLKAYMSGKDFRFGKDKKGKSSTLKAYAEDEDNSVWYLPVKDVTYKNEKISASMIKAFLDEGNVKLATELLGRHYSICGTVIRGEGRGKTVVGYPTMNIKWDENKYAVKEGVYAVKCTVGEQTYYGIANFGARPTFGEEEPLLEVYLDGFSGEVYDETVKVEFLRYLRNISKFDGADALGAQLTDDITLVREEAALAEAEAAAAAAAAEQSVEEAAKEVTEQPDEEAKDETPLVDEIKEETKQPVKEETKQIVAEVKQEEIKQPVEEVKEIKEKVIKQTVQEVVEETTWHAVEESEEDIGEQSVEGKNEITEQPVIEIKDGITAQPVEEVKDVKEKVTIQPAHEIVEETTWHAVEDTEEEVTEQPLEDGKKEFAEQPVIEIKDKITAQLVDEAERKVTEQSVEEVKEEVPVHDVEKVEEEVTEQPSNETKEETEESNND